jgi:hypothetical protein
LIPYRDIVTLIVGIAATKEAFLSGRGSADAACQPDPDWVVNHQRNQVSEKTMKLLLPLLILLTGAAPSAAIAAEADLQEQSAPTPPETETNGRSANDVLNMLSQRLALSDDQKSKILPILVERRQKIQEVLADSTLRRRQKMGQLGGILEDSDKRINALLSPEQQKTYAVVEQEVKAKMKARHSRTATTAN